MGNTKIRNNSAHLKVLPPLRCEVTHKILPEQRLLPGENLVPEEYVAQALGGMQDKQFVINGAKNGHPGIAEVLRSSDISILQNSQGSDLNNPADLLNIKVDVAKGMIDGQTDRNTLIEWFMKDGRKGIQAMIQERAKALNFELPPHPGK